MPKHGKVTSLSLRGCFLQTSVFGNRDQRLHINLWLPTQEWLKLRGTVLYEMPKIGFGLGFRPPSEDEEQHLLTTMDYYEINPPKR